MSDVKIIYPSAWAKFQALPDLLVAPIGKQLAIESDGLVQAQKRACPVSVDLEKTPGELRQSIHQYANPQRPMSYRVIADARAEDGDFIGPHVEFGHLAVNGSHVRPWPFFFPVYRSRRKAMRRRMLAAARKAIKDIMSNG